MGNRVRVRIRGKVSFKLGPGYKVGMEQGFGIGIEKIVEIRVRIRI